MGLREDAEDLVRAHQRAAAEENVLAPWADPELPEWCSELATALWRGSFRPSPVYYRADDPTHAWRGPHAARLHHLGYGWQLTALHKHSERIATSTAVVLETGSLWRGVGGGRRPGRGLRALGGQSAIEGLQPGHDVHFAVRRFDEHGAEAEAERRLLFGVAGLAALIEDAIGVGEHGELEWRL